MSFVSGQPEMNIYEPCPRPDPTRYNPEIMPLLSEWQTNEELYISDSTSKTASSTINPIISPPPPVWSRNRPAAVAIISISEFLYQRNIYDSYTFGRTGLETDEEENVIENAKCFRVSRRSTTFRIYSVSTLDAFYDNIYLLRIETYRTLSQRAMADRAEAVAYLAGLGPVPQKHARVTIHHGGEEVPFIRDYLVGPLPVGNDTTMKPLDIYHSHDIPFNARGYVNPNESQSIWSFITPELSDAMQDLFGATARGDANDTLVTGASGPFSFDGKRRRMWFLWRKNVPGPYLHPVNFFHTVYNHQIYNTLDDFLSAYRNGTLIRTPTRPDTEDYSRTTRKRVGEPRDPDHLPGPRLVSFSGLQFRVDRATQYVSWMGWGMYLGFDRDMGLSLWDIRLKGERITTKYVGIAFNSLPSPARHCPYQYIAVYLPATTHSGLGSIVRERAICVFEMDTGRPVTRHTGYMEGEFGAVKGHLLTVRSISTIGNYDYVFDYMFQIDGTIEVRVSASGYLQGGYWEPSQEGYGGRIRDTTMGNLHDHVTVNFKVDLDIVGSSNSLLETTTSQESVRQPWFDPIEEEDDDWGSTVIQQKITKRIIETEDESKLKYPANFQGGYAIVNQEEKNRWGSPRGYAIYAGYNPVHNTVVGSRRLLNNANWARYNLAVSRRRDTEISSSSMWNMNLPGAPTVDFHRFFDGEDIVQEDLVAWVNVGMHHLVRLFIFLGS
ncbi:amine oxidase catalytic domain-containing protein [Gymnopus androsaceus JB14]|uniref:Amine oxidase n=1 Tax=Gymnopus androsaceus JB14 TaxID=1447944 RepID=A0A6A4H7E8_9AGAR|nr:amine oxidase catalytic domain-containing protein [Gymnopus androsaceus JB14]